MRIGSGKKKTPNSERKRVVSETKRFGEEVSAKEEIARLNKEIGKDEKILKEYRALLDKYEIAHNTSGADVRAAVEKVRAVSPKDAERVERILGGTESGGFNFIEVLSKNLEKNTQAVKDIEATGIVLDENGHIKRKPVENKIKIVGAEKPKEEQPRGPKPIRKKPTARREKFQEPSELDERLMELDPAVRERLLKFLEKKAKLFMELALKINALKGDGGTSVYHREAIEKSVEMAFAKLEKQAKKDKVLKEEFFADEETAQGLRDEMMLFGEQYLKAREELAKQGVEAPTTEEGRKALFRKLINQFRFEPDAPLQDHADPLVVESGALLQTYTRRPGETPSHPKGSGVMAILEKSGVRLGTEAVTSYSDSAVMAGGFALATAMIDAHFPGLPIVRFGSWVAALTLCYAFGLPFKNALTSKILDTGKLLTALPKTVAKHPVGAGMLAAAAVLAGHAVNEVREASLISETNAEIISTKSGEASRNLVQSLDSLTGHSQETGVQTGETQVQNAEEANHIRELFQYSDEILESFISRAHQQVNAGLEAERDPTLIPHLREQNPGMTFGESGDAGPGPKYQAKQSLYNGVAFGGDVPPNLRQIVTSARIEAGLNDGESLEDGIRRMYQEYEQEISTPIEHADGRMESPRERVLRLLDEIEKLQDTLRKQNIATSARDLFITGTPPVAPELVEYYTNQLREELQLINTHYASFHQKAEHAISTLTSASNDIVPGSTLSLSVPNFSMADALKPLTDIELVKENPEEARAREWFAGRFGGSPEQYQSQASFAVGSIGYLLSIALLFSGTGAFLNSFKKRSRRTAEDQPHHEHALRDVEEEVIDFWHEYVNTKVLPFIPGAAPYSRLRVRIALREYISQYVYDLGESHSVGDKLKEWIRTEVQPAQLSEDTRVLQGFEKILDKMRADPKHRARFIETLFPGYTKLAKSLNYRGDLLQKVAAGEKLTAQELKFLSTKKTKEGHQDYIEGLALESAHANLEREIADLQVRGKALSAILADLQVGADTYAVFREDQNPETKIINDGIVKIISARGYSFSLTGDQADASAANFVKPQDINTQHQEVIRRVAETNEGVIILQNIMAENNRRLDELKENLDAVNQNIVRHGLQARMRGGDFSIPQSILDNKDGAALRDALSRGGGVMEDVSHEIRDALRQVTRRDSAKGQHSVETQLESMAKTLFLSTEFKKFIQNVNFALPENERLHAELQVVYGEKTQATEVDGYKLDVPGFSFRVRLLRPDGQEFRVDASGKEMPATTETRIDDQDFQMSHVLRYDNDPARSAGSFMAWWQGAEKRVYSKIRKNWIRENFLNVDARKSEETKFKIPSTAEGAKAWLDDFYVGSSGAPAKILNYARADRARALVNSNVRARPEDMKIFVENNPSYGRVPPREQVERVLGLYYRLINKTGFIGGIQSFATRMQGITIDLDGEGYVISGNKKMLISDYIARNGKFPSR